MTQKQIKSSNFETSRCGLRSRNVIKANTRLAYHCKPVVVSEHDDEQMAAESSRARLVNQILRKPKQAVLPKEFGSYFVGAKNAEPSYLITSHSKSFPKKEPVLTTYPSIVQQSLRWNPNVETSSLSDYTADIDTSTDMEDTRHICKCENCTTKNCPSKISIASTLTPISVFKNNIMKFTDQYTMTSKFNDVSCGTLYPMLAAPKTSNIAVLTTDIAAIDLKDLYNKPSKHTDFMYEKPRPIPILKKKDYDSYYHNTRNFTNNTSVKHQAVRDTDILEDYKELNNSCSNTLLFKPNKIISEDNFVERNIDIYPGTIKSKTLYNEGISDEVFLSPRPVSVPFTPRIPMDYNKKSTISHHCVQDKYENDIPFCHRNESKYHQHCRQPRGCSLNNDTDVETLSQRHDVCKVIGKMCKETSKLTACMPKTILPRRVLTSNKDVDFYINSPIAKTMSKIKSSVNH